MHFSKLRISGDATSKLRSLRQRTGLTANLLCRLGFMLSLEEGSATGLAAPDEEGLEFNAYTLTGEYHGLFIGLLRHVENAANPESPASEQELLALLRTHIHRGVATLSARAKSALDIARLASSA